MKNIEALVRGIEVKPGSGFRVAEVDPSRTHGLTEEEGRALLVDLRKRIDELQYVLYAEGKRSVLVVLQAMDTGGKDGTIRDVFEGVNPCGVKVTSFKAPAGAELAHDFLWRHHLAMPPRGEIGVHNRSHYEGVLIERVRALVPEAAWRARYGQINAFERMLVENGTVVLKFFLHVSKAEQLERLRRRVNDPKRNWKFNPGDLEERKLWGAYMEAYEEMVRECSTPWAPWRVVPADKKWYRNALVAGTIVSAMEEMDLRLPKLSIDPASVRWT